jgi:Tfp pilus assembly protein PilF
MSRPPGRSQNCDSPESRPADTGAASSRQRSGAAESRPRVLALLLALATLLVYLPVRQNDFVDYDDGDYVTDNQMVQKGLTWGGVKWAFTTLRASNWHPVTWLSHMLDCELFGLNPAMHHLVNVMLHAANAVLLFACLLRLTKALWPCALIAALFAWHPLHVESVAWVAERKDVLSTFFGLWALWSYTRFVEESVARRPRAKVFYALALLTFALGLMSKPMLVTLPFVLLLLDYWPLRRLAADQGRIAGALKLALEKWPFFLLAAASCVITYLAQSQLGEGAVVSLAKVSLSYRLCNAVMSYGRYLLKMIWPIDLAVFYPLSSQITLVRIWAAVAAMTLAALSWLVWRARRACPYLLVGWLWYLGTLVPVIGLVQVGGAALADRYAYLPSIGVSIAAVFGLRDLVRRFRWRTAPVAAAAGLILAGCLALTEIQLRYWRDSYTLFAHAVAVTSENDIALINLGVALEHRGKVEEALTEYRAAARIAPERYQVHNNLGNLLDNLGKPEEALAEYREAVRLNPDLPLLHDGFGSVLAELGRFSEALNEFTNAARLDPRYPWPHFEIGKVLLKQGRDAEALKQLHEALRIDPDNFRILAYTAHVLAADANPQIRDGNTALLLAAKANALTGATQPFVLDAVGMACAETGNFPDAVEVTQKALDLAKAVDIKNLNGIRERLELYKRRQPWRESFLSTNTPAKN